MAPYSRYPASPEERRSSNWKIPDEVRKGASVPRAIPRSGMRQLHDYVEASTHECGGELKLPVCSMGLVGQMLLESMTGGSCACSVRPFLKVDTSSQSLASGLAASSAGAKNVTQKEEETQTCGSLSSYVLLQYIIIR
jgi:hypothetical protein